MNSIGKNFKRIQQQVADKWKTVTVTADDKW